MSTERRPTDTHDRSTRRAFLRHAVTGLGGLTLASLLDANGFFSATAQAPLGMAPPPAPATAKVKSVIYLFMFGGPSQMDLFDYKPALQRADGTSVEHEWRRGQMRVSQALGSRRNFQQHGETGQWCSDALPGLAAHMDKLAVLKSLYTDSFAHGSAVLQMNTGQTLQGHPAMGSWVTHGLGSRNPDLPPFVVMHDPRGGPISGPTNWSSGYMPADLQGTLFRATGDPLLDLSPDVGALNERRITRAIQRRQIEAIRELNAIHESTRSGVSELAARSASYDLAYRLQQTAPDALDLEQEDARTRALYQVDAPPGEHRLSVGAGVFGRQCLIARRLVERGVRFVQIYHGGGHQQQTWDAHNGVEENLSIHCPEIDGPVSGLLTDLEQRGLLDETLVLWGGEFGRQPVSQLNGAGQTRSEGGRDHNPRALTMWMAGGGVRPGSYGETDELGFEAVVNRHHLRDLHATVLHLLGIDHRELTYLHGGLERKLTGVVEAHPIQGVLA